MKQAGGLLFLSCVAAAAGRPAAFVSRIGGRRRRGCSLSAASDDTGTRRAKVLSPSVDAYTERQLSNIFGSGEDDGIATFVPLSLAGRWSHERQADDQGGGVEAMVLASPEHCADIANAYEEFLKSRDGSIDSDAIITALTIPIAPSLSPSAAKLLARAYAAAPLSKSVLLSLNSLLVNRDGGLFDNLPWSTWSVDPELRERDAADNTIEGKFTMGKRAAYQRFMGKDWQGRSLSLGNLARRIRYMLERSGEGGDLELEGDESASLDEEAAMMSLSQRLLQLEVKEARMEIAEREQQLAISRVRPREEGVDEDEATSQLELARNRLEVAESSLEELSSAVQSAAEESTPLLSLPRNNSKDRREQSKTQSLLLSIIDRLAEQENSPPYRGAIGYPAKLDTKTEMLEDSVLPYSSPYELLLEMIGEQLNSEVAACVLEPTSLLESNLVLGGALLLKRKGVQKSATISGETVSYTDDDDDLGNKGVLPRSLYVVECFSDEAVGVALASNIPVFVEEEICSRSGKVPVELHGEKAASIKAEHSGEDNSVDEMKALSFANRVPPVRPSGDADVAPQLEGERVASENESNRIRIPLTTSPELFGGPDQTPQNSSTRTSVFSTLNPVKSLGEYDKLSDDAKARLLLKLESFSGYLPRPRAIRMSSQAASAGYDDGSSPSLLDEILLPLIDESVRRQYMIRDAERRNDVAEVERLREEASPRQAALERAQRARDEGGFDDEAARLEEDAELYKALRADVTQDEGEYNRYLDRDEWYERETQARIKRLDKSRFGTLLDGIDLP